MTFDTWFLSAHPDIPLPGAAATLKLSAGGATVPFMARYRKEQTGNLDEVQIQRVLLAHEHFTEVTERRTFILEEIERQKKMTKELKEKLLATFDLATLEDLYLPFKVKRKTKAALAREAGILPLSDWIWNCGHGTEEPLPGQTLELWAFTFRNEELGFPDVPAVVQGAQDILTERIAEMQDLRELVRRETFARGGLAAGKGEESKPHSKYERYFEFFEKIETLRKPESSHRYLALRRGWLEKELTLAVSGPPDDETHEERMLARFVAAACTVPDSPGAAVLQKAARMALKAHVLPAIETEVHRALKDVADEAAIQVFAENLRKLLLASPFGARAVLGVDPGLRTGCKVAVVDDAGTYLSSTVLHLQTEGGRTAARKLLGEVLQAVPVKAIAVGNGTAGRETETFLRAALSELGLVTPVVMVSESGASVYSASEAAREEFPALDLTVRGAISIARRLQDPLAELVKVDPKSIGVGQYQHDVAAGSLKKSLGLVVESCVNQVGVNLNTASYHLLAHVSGIGPQLAKAVVEHRAKRGLFKARTELLEVPRFSKKAFEQSAGFLRIPGGAHPLDNTGVHPERYPLLEGLAGERGVSVADLLGPGAEAVKGALHVREEVGAFTFDDIVQELQKPGRDPREEFVAFQYREDVHALTDLKPGLTCPGIVTNVTNFGAFVDIGVHQDGLVHVSQLSDSFVKDPREVVHPGMRVQVRVLLVNLDKQQIALTMKSEAPRRKPVPIARGKAEHPRRAKSGHAKGHSRPAGKQAPAAPAGRPATAGPRVPLPRGGAPSAARPAAPPRRPEPARAPVPVKVPLNNPFAALLSLKKTLK